MTAGIASQDRLDERLPEAGRIEDVSIPALLVSLARTRFDGTLSLTQGTKRKALCLDRGFALRFENELPGESLLAGLVDHGDLSASELERVRSVASRRGCHELAVVLGIERLRPERLLERLRDHFWSDLESLFGWSEGEWHAEPGPPSHSSLHPLRTDPYPRIQAALSRQWSIDRLLRDLKNYADRYTSTGLPVRALLQRMQPDPMTSRLLEGLDGRRRFGEFLAEAARSPRALATTWILDAAGSLYHRKTPSFADPVLSESIAIEIVPAAERRSIRSEERQTPIPPSVPRLSRDAEQLQDEILVRLRNPADLDPYAVLGVDPGASPASVKKAYFRAAKRYHPDALRRHGLISIQREASDLFSQIAQAWEILGDTDRRREYDRALDTGTNAADADRLAQAETAFRKGEILLRKGDFRGAAQYLGPAVELWPEEAIYRSAFAWALYKQNTSEEARALEQLDRALELDPGSALTHFRLGIIHRALGNTDQSADHLARSRELDPESSRTRPF